MADNPVAIEELRVMATYFCEAELPYFEELREAFKLLRHTGCRIQEIFDISRWEVSAGYTVTFLPQKGNTTRTIVLNSDFDDFLAAIQGQYNPFLGRTYSQLQGLFYKINPYGKLYSATKEITNYFFRYLFVRELNELGFTLQQIADEMGYTSTTAVNNYLNAELTSTIEVPVTPPDPLPEGHIDIFTEEIVFDGATDSFLIDFDPAIELFTLWIDCIPVNTVEGFLVSNQYFYENKYFPHFTIAKYNQYAALKGTIGKRNPSILAGYSANILISTTHKSVTTFDYSVQGSGGSLYRDIICKRYEPSGLQYNVTSLNRYMQYPQSNKLLVGCRKSSGGVISNPVKATIFKLIFWRRILSAEEIATLFSL